MNKQVKLIRGKVGLLKLAEELGNISLQAERTKKRAKPARTGFGNTVV